MGAILGHITMLSVAEFHRFQQRRRFAFIQGFYGFIQGAQQSVHDLLSFRERRTLGHQYSRIDYIALKIRKGLKLNRAGCNQAY